MKKALQVKDLIQDLVDKGATSVEQIHKAIADMPFDAIRKVEPLEESASLAKKAHHETVGSVYNLIRTINKEVGKFAGEILEGKKD